MQMMALGNFRFSVATAAYQELVRATEYRWAATSRVGRPPARQFVGVGDDTVTLAGVIYPHYRGGLGQVAAMRTAAEQGEPQRLVTGGGLVLGLWVINRVEETQRAHWPDGSPRRQDFRIELSAYGEDAA